MPSPVGERQFGRHFRRRFGCEGNCESKMVSRQWGDNFCPARHQDVSQGPLGHYSAPGRWGRPKRGPSNCQPDFMMRCAKGFVAKGIWGCTGFPLLCWDKGSETPSCQRGSLRPFVPPQKGKPRTSPNPLSDKPLSATHHFNQIPRKVHVVKIRYACSGRALDRVKGHQTKAATK